MNTNGHSGHCRIYVCVQRDSQMQQTELNEMMSSRHKSIETDQEPFPKVNLPSGSHKVKYWDKSTINQPIRTLQDDAASDPIDLRRSLPGNGRQSFGRPASLSSVASSLSSRTSRCSDYFGAASGLEQVDALQCFENSNRVPVDRNMTLVNCVEETTHDLDKKKVSVQDINKRLSEVDHLSPISSMAMTDDPALTYVDRIMLELLETERMYVRALEDVLGGYLLAMKSATDLPMTQKTVDDLFGNIKKIYVFNRKFLSSLENCVGVPTAIANCFIKEEKGFQVYADYCTNYPKSIGIMTRCMKVNSFAEFLKAQQAHLQHALPLGSYLLKPVQRVLKYHLLIQDLLKNCKTTIEDCSAMEQALLVMTKLAHHINEMKRKHEDTVYIQGGELATYGEILKEGELKLQGAKTGRYVYLFDKMLLITKKRDDGIVMCKYHILCSNIILLESVSANPLSFIVTPFNDPSSNHGPISKPREKIQHQLTTQTLSDKLDWTYHIKKLIIKHHPTAIPLKAQRTILRMNSFGGNGTNPIQDGSPALGVEEKNLFSRIGSFGKIRRRSDSSSRKFLLQAANRKTENCNSLPCSPSISNQKTLKFDFTTESHNQEQSGLVKDNTDFTSLNTVLRRKNISVNRQHELTPTVYPFQDCGDKPQIVNSNSANVCYDNENIVEDLLHLNFENNRQSVSWDIQIVDEIFKQYRNYPIGLVTGSKTDQDSQGTLLEVPPVICKAQKQFVKGMVKKLDMPIDNNEEDVADTLSQQPNLSIDTTTDLITLPLSLPQTEMEVGNRQIDHVHLNHQPTETSGKDTNVDGQKQAVADKFSDSHQENDEKDANLLPLKHTDIIHNCDSKPTSNRQKRRRVAHFNNKVNTDTKRIPSGIVRAALSKYESYS